MVPPRSWSGTAVALTCALCATLGCLAALAMQRGSDIRAPLDTNQNLISDPLASSAPKVSTATAPKNEKHPRGSLHDWDTLARQPSSPARNRRMAEWIRELARTDPRRALQLAEGISDWRLAATFKKAALQGWAAQHPSGAADYVLGAPRDDRRALAEAVLQGASEKPAEALAVALRLCQSDPEPAGDIGHYAVDALVQAGAFQEAVRFGQQVGAEKYPFLLKSAYFQWSRYDPAKALAEAQGVTDPATRATVQAETLAGWAWADAKGLAAHALSLPSGAERSQALAEALPLWVERDPAGAAAWIQQHESGPEFDAGIAALANAPSLLFERPATALSLAANISDPAKRSHTLRAVFRQWATREPAQARQFADAAPQADRALLLHELADLSPQ